MGLVQRREKGELSKLYEDGQYHQATICMYAFSSFDRNAAKPYCKHANESKDVCPAINVDSLAQKQVSRSLRTARHFLIIHIQWWGAMPHWSLKCPISENYLPHHFNGALLIQ